MKLYNFTRQVEEIAREIVKRLGFEFDIEKIDIRFPDDNNQDYISVEYQDEYVSAYVFIHIVGEEIQYDICSTTINFDQ